MAPNVPRTRRGRPPNYVKDSNAHEVVGLSPLPVRNKAGELLRYRYYATYSKPRVYFGYEIKEAIAAFRCWQSKQRSIQVELEVPTEWSEQQQVTIQDALADPVYARVGQILTDIEPIDYVAIPESVFWKKVSEVFATEKGRRKAAKLTGIEMIRRIKDTSAFPRVLSLLEVGRLHFGKRDDVGALEAGQAGYDTREYRKSWLYWTEFVEAVGVKTVDDVTRESLVKYREFVYGLQDGTISARTIFNRYNHISTILNNARDRRENHTETIDKLKDGFQVICRKKRPKVETGIPTPIDVEDFSAMLSAVQDNKKWRAIVFLAMNCGLHPGECTGLHLEDLDLRKRHLWDNRNKTQEQRCSMLWNETVEAVEAHLRECDPPCPYLFVNKDGERHNSDQFGKEFKRTVLKPAQIKRVTFEWFRDSGTNAASKRGVDSDKVRMWLGHRRGELDKYDLRHPSKTQPVVDAIYAEYFDGETAA